MKTIFVFTVAFIVGSIAAHAWIYVTNNSNPHGIAVPR